MDATLIVGYLASICSVASFIPQAWKVVKTGDTSALSVYCLTVTGFALWTVFGFMRGELPIILTNAICFCLSAFILFRKLTDRDGQGNAR